jgi:hypothetical protein
MKLFFFLSFNVLNYFFFLCLLNNFFKNRYIYPFRILEIINYLINLIIFGILSFFYFNINVLIAIIILNTNFLYIMFHIQNMINTSPRTKILLCLINRKSTINKYNEKVIVNNRIRRLASSNQIIRKNNLILINKKKKFFSFIYFLFILIKKI